MIGAEIARLHAENYGVYGVRKMQEKLVPDLYGMLDAWLT
jgi:hypothetical protein